MANKRAETESKKAVKRASKAHTRYRNAAGDIVPGVTTILRGVEDNSLLIKWSNDIGLEGIDQTEYLRTSGAIGTRAHALIHSFLTHEDLPDSELPPHLEKFAENALASFHSWFDSRAIRVVQAEKALSCDRYGGTADLIAYVDGDLCLIDFKTGNYVPKHVVCQMEAYARLFDAQLLEPIEIQSLISLQLDKDGPSAVQQVYDRKDERMADWWGYFEDALSIYNRRKILKWT